MTAVAINWWVTWLCGILAGGLAFFSRSIFRRFKKDRNKQDALWAGLRSLLRDSIIWSHNHYTEKGYCPIYARENIEDMYNQYHVLGGNGVVTSLVEELKDLPTKKEDVS